MKNWSKRTKVRVLFSAITACLLIGTITWAWPKEPNFTKISYTEFLDLVKSGKIKKVDIQYDLIRGNLPIDSAESSDSIGKPFEVSVNTNYVKPTEELAKYGVSITFHGYNRGSSQRETIGILSCIGILILWAYFFFGGIGPLGEVSLKFWKSGNDRFVKLKQKVMFADVAGIDEAKAELWEIVEFLKNPEEFERLGGRIPRGVLLVGPPGNGKTLLARAVANEANVAFIEKSGSDFVEMYVGVGARRIRAMSNEAKAKGRAIIYIDEIDSLGGKRMSPSSGGDREYQQTLNALLTEMDGFEKNSGVVYMASTNRPDVLDDALTRSGRFDRRVVVSRPDAKGREQIFRVHIRKQKVPLGADVNLYDIALATPGFSGADIENLVNEAALSATRDVPKRKEVLHRDFIFAKDKIMLGVESTSKARPEDEMRLSANHEAGHALVAALVAHADQIEKVTTAARGATGGGVYSLPKEGGFYTKEYLLAQLAVLMGGRIAEEMFLRTLSTGAQNDIERANDIAWQMVCSWGMSHLGPISVDTGTQTDPKHGSVPSGKTQTLSEAKKRRVEGAVEKLISDAERVARDIFSQHGDLHAKLAAMLLEQQTVDGKDVYELVGDLRGSVKIG